MLAALAGAHAQGWTTYVGDLGPDSVLLAWGKPGRGNVIGREAISYGKARVTVGSHRVEVDRAWARVDGLEPDTRFGYVIEINGETVGQGTIRTWPRQANRLSFLVLGDYGNGSREQALLGGAMAKLVDERAGSERPIRFALTTGDNIYGSWLTKGRGGSNDVDWWPRFFGCSPGSWGRFRYFLHWATMTEMSRRSAAICRRTWTTSFFQEASRPAGTDSGSAGWPTSLRWTRLRTARQALRLPCIYRMAIRRHGCDGNWHCPRRLGRSRTSTIRSSMRDLSTNRPRRTNAYSIG